MANKLPAHLSAWLRRADQHPVKQHYLLSGSSLIALYCPNARQPEDIDYVGTITYDPEVVMLSLEQIAEKDDAYDTLEIDDLYEIFTYNTPDFPGVRADLISKNQQTHHEYTVDVAFGDPMSLPPRLIEVPDVGPVLSVALETLYAWKLHAIVQFADSWRPKDVYDLYVMTEQADLDYAALPKAIRLAFSSRGNELYELDAFRTQIDWGITKHELNNWYRFAQTYSIATPFDTIRDTVRNKIHKLI
jgi:hypothetical protein